AKTRGVSRLVPRQRHWAVGPGGGYSLPQLLAGLEERHRLFIDRHRLTGPRVAAGPGVAALDGERAEPAQFHPGAPSQRRGDFIEYRADDGFHVRAAQMRIIRREPGNQL